MNLARRWQDWATVLIGGLVAISPSVFNTAGTASWAQAAATCSAIGFGGLILVAGAFSLAFPRAGWLEFVAVGFAVLLFASPVLFSYTAINAVASTAYIGGVAVVAALATRLMEAGPALTPTS